jgi:hypothetical protein
VAGCHVVTGRFAVALLIVEEYIGIEGAQKLSFVTPTEK